MFGSSFPQLPPRPKDVIFSSSKPSFSVGEIKSRRHLADNPDEFYLKDRIIIGNCLPSEMFHKKKNEERSRLKTRSLEIRKESRKSSQRESTFHELALFKISEDNTLPLSPELLRFFSHRNPRGFLQALKFINDYETLSENLKASEIIYMDRNECTFGVDFLNKLIAYQKHPLFEGTNNEVREMKMLRSFSTQLLMTNTQHLAVMINGCSRSFNVLLDADKANTYFHYEKHLHRCCFGFLDQSMCTLTGHEQGSDKKKVHEAMTIGAGDTIPGFVASTNKISVQEKGKINENFPKGIGDLFLSDYSTAICLPLTDEQKNIIAVIELIRLEDDNTIDFNLREKMCAFEILGWMETAILLALEVSMAKDSIAIGKQLNHVLGKLKSKNWSFEEIINWAAVMVRDQVQAEVVWFMRCVDDYFVVNVAKGKKDVRLEKIKMQGQRTGFFWNCATKRKTVEIDGPLRELYEKGNKFLLDLCFGHIDLNSIRARRIHFLLEPVIFMADKETQKYRDHLRFSLEDGETVPLQIHEMPSAFGSMMVQEVICVIGCSNRQNRLEGFYQADKDKLQQIALILANILKITQINHRMSKNIQLYDLSMEIFSYHTLPTATEVDNSRRIYEKWLTIWKDANTLDRLTFVIPEQDYEFQKNLQIYIAYQFLQHLNLPLPRIIKTVLSVYKQQIENPYHNNYHTVLVSHAALYMSNHYCEKFTLLEKASFFLSIYFSSVAHRGITSNGMTQLKESVTRLFPQSPVESLCFEIALQMLINSEEGLFNELDPQVVNEMLHLVKQIIMMGDSKEFNYTLYNFEQIMVSMKWSQQDHRLVVLKLLSGVCMSENIYKSSEMMIDITVNKIQAELLTEGYELAKAGLVVPEIFNGKCYHKWWRIWHERIAKVCDTMELLAKLMPECQPLTEMMKNNLIYLGENREEFDAAFEKAAKHFYKEDEELQA